MPRGWVLLLVLLTANPEHVALAVHVHELLDAAGLLGPLQPFGPSP